MFGEFPQVYIRSEAPDQRGSVARRSKIANAAWLEMQNHMSLLRLNRALKHKTTAAADMSYKVGDNVLVWREKVVVSRIGEWLGPFMISAIDVTNKLVYVQDEHISGANPFSLAQVKRYYELEMLANSFFSELRDSFSSFATPVDEEFLLTETIEKKNPRASSKAMTKA